MADADLIIALAAEQKNVTATLDQVIQRIDGLGKKLSTVGKDVASTNSKLSAVKGTLMQMQKGVGRASMALNTLGVDLGNSATKAMGLATNMGMLVAVLGPVGAGLAGLIAGMVALQKWLTKTPAMIVELSKELDEAAKRVAALGKEVDDFNEKARFSGMSQAKTMVTKFDDEYQGLQDRLRDIERERGRYWIESQNAFDKMPALVNLQRLEKEKKKLLDTLDELQRKRDEAAGMLDVAESENYLKMWQAPEKGLITLKEFQRKQKEARQKALQALEGQLDEEARIYELHHAKIVKMFEAGERYTARISKPAVQMPTPGEISRFAREAQIGGIAINPATGAGEAEEAGIAEYRQAAFAGGQKALDDMRNAQAEWSEKFAKDEKTVWDQITTGFLERVGSTLYDLAMSAGEAMVKPLSQSMDIIFSALGGASVGDVKKMVADATAFWTNLAQNLGPVLEYLVKEGIPTIIDAFVASIPTIIDALVQWVPGLVMALTNAIPVVIKALVAKLPEIVEMIIPLATEFVTAIILMIPDIVVAFVAKVPDIITAIAKGVYEALKKILEGLLGGSETGAEWFDKSIGKVPILGPVIGYVGKKLNSIMPWNWHEGGYVEKMNANMKMLSNAVRAHSGMYVPNRLATDEVPAILQAGEGVLTRSVVQAMGGRAAVDEMNRTGRTRGGEVHEHYEFRPAYLFASDGATVVDEMLGEMARKKIGRVADGISRARGTPGFRSARGRR